MSPNFRVGDRVRVRRNQFAPGTSYAKFEGRTGKIGNLLKSFPSAHVILDPAPRERSSKFMLFSLRSLEPETNPKTER